MKDNLERFMAGFHGHDAMREKAMRMLGPELRATDMRTPESMSSPGRTNMRPFRKGGHAAHRVSREQSDLHIPRKVKSEPIRKYTKDGHPKFGIGGFFGDLMRGIPLVNMVTGPIADAAGLKKGGKVSHRCHRAEGGETRAEGGAMRRGGHAKRPKYGLGGMIAGAAGAPVLNKIPKVGKYMAQNLGMFGGLLPFAEGGHADGGAMRRGGRTRRRHRAEGGMMGMEPEVSTFNEGGEAKRRGGSVRRKHRAQGGATYTYQGRPYTPPEGWANPVRSPDGLIHTYAEGGEAKRRGGKVHRKHRAEGGAMQEPALIANAKRRWADNHPDGALYAEGGEAKRRGGKVHRKHRAEGGEAKFGFGGDLATAAGAYKSFSPETRQRIGNVGKNLWNAGKAAFGYAEGGEAPFSNARRGGHMKKHQKYAAGGVAKIRHGQATREGHPINRRIVKGR